MYFYIFFKVAYRKLGYSNFQALQWLRVCNKEGSTCKRGYLKQQKFNKMKDTQPKIMTRWMQAVGRRVKGYQPPAYIGWPADQVSLISQTTLLHPPAFRR